MPAFFPVRRRTPESRLLTTFAPGFKGGAKGLKREPMIDPVRPCRSPRSRRRASGSPARPAHAGARLAGARARGAAGARHPGQSQARIFQPTSGTYKIRGAVPMRWQLGADERARGVWTVSAGNMPARASLMRRGPRASTAHGRGDRDRAAAPSSSAWRRWARGSCRSPTTTAWRAVEEHRFAGWRALFIHPFDNALYRMATRPWGWRSSRTRPMCGHGHRRDRRRRADHRRRQRDPGAAAGRQGARGRAGDAAPVRAVAARGRADAAFRTGRRRSSTARAARASPSACGSACAR